MPRTILTTLALFSLLAELARAQPPAAERPASMGVRKLAPAGPGEIVEGDRPVLRYFRLIPALRLMRSMSRPLMYWSRFCHTP